jgi:hypothetical protein
VVLRHLKRIGIRALAATLILWAMVSFPIPLLPGRYFLLLQAPLSIFLFLVYVGKLLYDTFFYDRYGQ